MAIFVDISRITDWKTVLRKVKEGKKEYVIKVGEEPVAAVISFDSYKQWARAKNVAKQEFFGIVDRVQEQAKLQEPETIQSIIEEAVGESRKPA